MVLAGFWVCRELHRFTVFFPQARIVFWIGVGATQLNFARFDQGWARSFESLCCRLGIVFIKSLKKSDRFLVISERGINRREDVKGVDSVVVVNHFLFRFVSNSDQLY